MNTLKNAGQIMVLVLATGVPYQHAISETKTLTPMIRSPVVQMKTFTVKGGDAYNYAKSHGFKFIATKNDSTSQCAISGSSGYSLRTIAKSSPATGSKCDFVLFGGRQLNNGWTYYGKTFNGLACQTAQGEPRGGNRGYSIKLMPERGSKSTQMKFHQWIEASGLNLRALDGGCSLAIDSITLQGPATGKWQDAFR